MPRRKKREAVQQEQEMESGAVPEAAPQGADAGAGAEVPAADPGAGEAPQGEDAHLGLVELPEEAIKRLTGELEQLNDRYLRLAAEFDNYRKRMARDRSQMRAQAQADLMRDALEALDDLNRVTSQDHGPAKVEDLLAGVDLVERKLMGELERAGLERVGVAGVPFDPNDHEAVGMLPAPTAAEDGTVAAVLQVGYRFGGMLLRPARVQVYTALEPAGESGA